MSDARPKVYLLDVEGTVAPLSLTSEVLFPYARAHFEKFLWSVVPELASIRQNPDQSPEGMIFTDMMMLAHENQAETDPDAPRYSPEVREIPASEGERSCVSMRLDYAIPRTLEYVNWLMDRDRKSTALKSLQGKIWKAGFESGELKGTLFDDVPDAFRRWSADARVAIYSSGSVDAQKLLFRHSIFGDLTPLISGYFDTRTGPKMERASYAAIAAATHVTPQELLFFSDSVRELDAAREAGCATRLVMRSGNAPVENANGHSVVESFAGL
jgi:enolase-phosphatase E1